MKSENPGISIGDVAKKLGDQWSKLTAKDKAPYEQKGLKLKEKYEKVYIKKKKPTQFWGRWYKVLCS